METSYEIPEPVYTPKISVSNIKIKPEKCILPVYMHPKTGYTQINPMGWERRPYALSVTY